MTAAHRQSRDVAACGIGQIARLAQSCSYGIEDQTARTPELSTACSPARARGDGQRQTRGRRIAGDDRPGRRRLPLAPWDWAFYSEKLRVQKYSFDESRLKPYLELTNVLEKGVCLCRQPTLWHHLRQRNDLPVYHPDVRCTTTGRLRYKHSPCSLQTCMRVRRARGRLDEFPCIPVAPAWASAGGGESPQCDEAACGRADTAHLGRGHHCFPRVRACAARHVSRT